MTSRSAFNIAIILDKRQMWTLHPISHLPMLTFTLSNWHLIARLSVWKCWERCLTVFWILRGICNKHGHWPMPWKDILLFIHWQCITLLRINGHWFEQGRSYWLFVDNQLPPKKVNTSNKDGGSGEAVAFNCERRSFTISHITCLVNGRTKVPKLSQKRPDFASKILQWKIIPLKW